MGEQRGAGRIDSGLIHVLSALSLMVAGCQETKSRTTEPLTWHVPFDAPNEPDAVTITELFAASRGLVLRGELVWVESDGRKIAVVFPIPGTGGREIERQSGGEAVRVFEPVGITQVGSSAGGARRLVVPCHERSIESSWSASFIRDARRVRAATGTGEIE